MQMQALITTIVSGVLALGMLIAITVLLVSSVDVPEYMAPLFATLIGAALGSARAAT